MRNIRDHVSGDLFDRWEHLGKKRHQRLLKSWAGVFREHVINKLPVGKIAVEFDSKMGRPTKDIPVVLGALILQQIFNLTDAETADGIAFDAKWQYALDVRSDSDLEVTDRTLRNYRRLVVELGLDEVIFKDVTDELIKAFGVDVSKQRIDSTAFQSAMRILTRLGTFVETVSKFIRELKRTMPELYEKIDPEIIRKYVDRQGEGCFPYRPIETRKRLPEAAATLYEIYTMFRATKAAELESFRLLERVFTEQCEVTDDGNGGGGKLRIKTPEEVGCENVNNPSDPDSTYNRHKGQGYKAQVMETYTEEKSKDKKVPDLITHVCLNKMTQTDHGALKPALIDLEARGIKPKVVIGDTHYGSKDTVKNAKKNHGVEVIAPVQPPKGHKKGILSLEHFELDDDGLVVCCPAGVKPASRNAMKNKLDARFRKEDCADCELRESCTCGIQVSKGKKPRLWYTYGRAERRKKLLAQKEAEFKNKYRWRAGIEASISRLKHFVGLENLRVRGEPAIDYALHLKSLGLNIMRCAAFRGKKAYISWSFLNINKLFVRLKFKYNHDGF